MTTRPPRWARYVVVRVARAEDRGSIVRDLDDEFRLMIEEGATAAEARRWYRRQVARSLPPLLAARRGSIHWVAEFLIGEGSMWRDVKLAVRTLLKRPGFCGIVIATLALGIGATSAVFSLIQGVLLTPPPYEDPDRLALVLPAYEDGREGTPPAWAADLWLSWQERSDVFESVAAYDWGFTFIVSDQGSESIQGLRVTPEYFQTTGLTPVIGRVFDESDLAGDGDSPVVVLGHDLWQRRFGGDPGVLGQSIRLARTSPDPVVIGVMPANVRFLPDPQAAQEPGYDIDATIDYWIPAALSRASDAEVLQRPRWKVLGRLSPGMDAEAAQAELAVLTRARAETAPDLRGIAPAVLPVIDVANAEGRRILLPLLAAAALVLLIACGNAAALLLVRGLQKRPEYVVRSTLGAGRASLVRLVTVESLLLALTGGILGVGLAASIVRGFKAVGGYAVPRLDLVTIGWPVALFGLGAALLATLVAGAYPAINASRHAARGGPGGSGSRATAGLRERRLLSGVTMVQAALTLTLLVGAGLLIRTMQNLGAVDSGFEGERVLTMSFTAVEGGDYRDIHNRALESVLALPEVDHAAFAWGVPLTGNSWPTSLEVEGFAQGGREERIQLPVRSVTPGYFDLLGQSIVDGRDFVASDDRESSTVAVIVNQTFVDRYLGGSAAVGREVFRIGRDDERFALTIVGVVSDARTNDLTRQPEPEIFGSLWQLGAFSKHLVARTTGEPAGTIADIQRAVRSVAPSVAIENPLTLGQIREESLASRTFAMQLLAGFAVVASVLTLGGIYGVLSLSVAARRREIAIRAAVGAARRNVLRMVLREGIRVIVVGVVVGLVGAVGLSGLLGAFLYGVAPTDPLTLVVVALSFSAVALVACWFPAYRAALVDPAHALREE